LNNNSRSANVRVSASIQPRGFFRLIAEGDIELATVLAVLSLLGSLVSIPGYLMLYASLASASVPVAKIIESVVYTLVLPFLAGQATRYGLLKAGGARGLGKAEIEGRIKHGLQLLTIISMLILVALLVASKAGLIVGKPLLAVEVIVFQALTMVVLLGLVEVVDRALKITYGAHSAIAFISATKNQSIATAIAVMALEAKAALVPIVQAPIAISYLQRLIKRRS